jgi:hypothetical protein
MTTVRGQKNGKVKALEIKPNSFGSGWMVVVHHANETVLTKVQPPADSCGGVTVLTYCAEKSGYEVIR